MSPLSFIGKLIPMFLVSTVPVDGKARNSKHHERIIPKRELDTRFESTQKTIVLLHNFYRAKVEPPASNMLEVKWLPEAQEEAQKWAEACKYLKHNNALSRRVRDLGNCGQNIYVSHAQIHWKHVLKKWFSEHKNFTYGSSNNDLELTGNYTQLVWYDTHRIGCGYYHCGSERVKTPFHNYICNYCPIGNDRKRLGRPYDAGKPCDQCPKNCKYKKLCTNSCPYRDFWVNCADINSTWHNWLCDEREDHHKACKSTCLCNKAIR